MSDLSLVIKPINIAKGLPNEHYIDDMVHQEEKESVLFANWSAIGFAKDVMNIGDVNPINFLGMPLLVARDNDQKVRVYQNTCRHRGMILISEKKEHTRDNSVPISFLVLWIGWSITLNTSCGRARAKYTSRYKKK